MANVALARVYQQSFESHPYYTLAFTNGALNALGDAVAQVTQRFVRNLFLSVRSYPEHHQIQRQEEPNRRYQPRYDISRTMRFFAFGFGMGA